MKKYAGFTWVSILMVLTVLGGLLTMGAPHWQVWRARQAKKIGFHEVKHILAFARTEAFLRGAPLNLSPIDASGNWALGVQLQANKQFSPIRVWHFPRNIQLTWHGFLGHAHIPIGASPEHLAMNGYFLFEALHMAPEKWAVNRFGQIRVLTKHVA